jgi:hypothetical protein
MFSKGNSKRDYPKGVTLNAVLLVFKTIFQATERFTTEINMQ